MRMILIGPPGAGMSYALDAHAPRVGFPRACNHPLTLAVI
jgi:hypothetical protein